jgi:hydrogenase maturation protease
MLIIGCGNRRCSDDGAGILVAERLRQLGIDADTRTDDVIVVDAVVTGAPAGTVQVWDGRQPLDFVRTTASTHCFGVAEAIELARVLNRLPTRLQVYGIEGLRFEPGVEISPEVQRAVEGVVQRIMAELDAPPDSRGHSPLDTAF